MNRVRVTTPVDGVQETVLYQALDAAGAPVPGPRVAVVAVMHGNEPVGDVVLDRFAREVRDRLVAGSVLAVRANHEACRLGLRHTPGSVDMNRLWDADNLARLEAADPSTLSFEGRRVRELAPLLLACDAVLDLHSTSQPAPPFLLFRDDQRHASLAVRLGVRRIITGVHEGGLTDGGLCANVGLRPGDRCPRLGFTFEAGQHSDPTNAERAWGVVTRLLGALELWRDPVPAAEPEVEIYDMIDRMVQAPVGEVPWRFVGYEGGEPGAGRSGPPRKLQSFERVEADEIVLRRGRSVVRAQAPFIMLMPTPTADPGTDLYYVAQRRDGGRGVRPVERTHAEARLQAHAIERMLDLVGDDELERGSTLFTCDDRSVFDQCADAIARVVRLPHGHPHRRVTVVGRGDWGGDEVERRAGRRYRQAMRRALVEGVPVTRVQLLRGASLAWLDALASPSVAEMLRARARDNDGRTDLRFFVSARQPHTVSVLVLGDLERALRDGDARLVRVGLVVEAANVEPVQDTVRVRTKRAGLFSARPEVLRATSRLLGTLVQEHHHIVSTPPLSGDAGFQALLGPDGAIEPPADLEALGTMRRALRGLQLRLWRRVLEPAASSSLDGDRARADWVASTMAGSGIRDAAALEALLVRRDDGTWSFDPARLQAASADPDRFTPPRGPRRHAPPQPLAAADVDADDLERWIGWKRSLRTVQLVPDTRGKDVDLGFTVADIHRRMCRLFDRARDLAHEAPGRVMVVLAGDGHSPTRERPDAAPDLLRAHRELLLDPSVRYLRIQHAPGTHLSWMKDFLDLVGRRPVGAQPVGLQWEGEHGASVHVALLAVRDAAAPEAHDWSLEGWSLRACGVVLSDLAGAGREVQVGVFTERGTSGRIDQGLVHFARAHCEGLLAQGGHRAFGSRPQEIEGAVLRQLGVWIDRVRAWRRADAHGDVDADWIADRLGLADARLARALDRIGPDARSQDAARRLWDTVPSWPGPAWDALVRS